MFVGENIITLNYDERKLLTLGNNNLELLW